MLLAVKVQMLPLPLFVTLAALMMFAFGLMFANFTWLAMEPQGYIAGTASSLYGSITTLLGIGIGTTIGQDYDGTLFPFATGFFLHAGVLGGRVGGRKGSAVQAAHEASYVSRPVKQWRISGNFSGETSHRCGSRRFRL
jgi:hypothetical protein